jgi:nucleoside-diphosphate-sugar epimerase
MKILVSDTNAYISCLLVSSLRQRGHEVFGIDTRVYIGQDCDRTAPTSWLHHKQIRHLTADDLIDIEAIVHTDEVFANPSVHATIICNTHYQDAMHLATIARAAGVRRFIYLSDCVVYGATDQHVTEESPVSPQTPYATCKALVERELRVIADDSFSPTILRNAIAFGASPRMRFDIVLNNLAGLAWMTKELAIPNYSHFWCPLVHVLDICQAIVCTLEAPYDLIHNQIFNVGNTAHNYQLKEIAAVVAEVFQVSHLSFGKKDANIHNLRVSFDKINQLLPCFRCDWNAQRGVQQLFSFFTLTDMVKSSFLLE